MSCTYKAYRLTDPTSPTGSYTAVKVTSSDGLIMWMPTTDDFDAIRFHIATTSHTGGRLANAYMNEGRFAIQPTAEYVPCIKAIYQIVEFDPDRINPVTGARGMYVDKSVGNWIYDEACKCLEKSIDEGRLDLGDGFVVPSTGEQASISTLVIAEGKGFLEAIQTVCPDITPPLEAIACIENGIKTTNWQFYDIYRACHADYITAQSNLPGDGELPPSKPKSNILNYLLAGVLLLLLLSRKA